MISDLLLETVVLHSELLDYQRVLHDGVYFLRVWLEFVEASAFSGAAAEWIMAVAWDEAPP